jgi:hypothetical protein
VGASGRQDRHSGGAGCSIELGVTDPQSTRYLPSVSLPTELQHEFVDLAETRRTDGLTLGYESPVVSQPRQSPVAAETASREGELASSTLRAGLG